MQQLTLALDWTPNINHIGFFVAREKEFYRDAGLELGIADPASDNYETTPAKKVELGRADLALCPMESVLSYRTKTKPFPLKAIAAIFQEDLSAIACLGDSGIQRPQQLDGKVYASYRARYEDEIVKEMVRNDGGAGALQLIYPEKLGIWNTLLEGKADATWIFVNWEGVQAAGEGVDLRLFRMKEFGIPYSYSPVIAAGEETIRERETACRAFLKGSRSGFMWAKAHPGEALKILEPFIPEHERSLDLGQALQGSAAAFGTEREWGRMEPDKLQAYLDWIYERELEDKVLAPAELFTNHLLD